MSQILLGASILEETHHLVRGKILLEGSERGLAVNFLQKMKCVNLGQAFFQILDSKNRKTALFHRVDIL